MAETRIRIVVEGEDRNARRVITGVGDALANMGSQARGIGGSLRNVFEFAGGQLVADGIRNIAGSLIDLGSQALDSYASIETLQLALQSMSAKELVKSGVTDDLQVAFEMSSERAGVLYDWVKKLAIASPFEMEDVSTAFRLAQSYGFGSEQAMRLTQATLDYAAANGISGANLDRVTRALGQMRTRGKVAGGELLQLSEVGIGGVEILANAFHVTTAEMMKMVEKGLVPADVAIEAIVQSMEHDATGAAERFSQTWTGLLASLSDIKGFALADFITGFADAFKPVLADLVTMLQSPEISASIKALGDRLGDAVGTGVQKIRDAFAGFQSGGLTGLAQALEVPPVIIGALGFAARNIDILKGAVLGLGGVLAAGALVAGLTAVAGALATLISPIGLITLGAMALGAAWTTNFGGIQEKTQAVIDFLRPGFAELLSWISSASQGDFAPLQAGLQGALQTVSATIQAFRWEDFVAKLGDWSAYIAPIAWDAIVAAVDWGAYITALDWTGIITTALDWATWIPALSWAGFITALEWSAYIADFAWSSFINGLDWATATGSGITWTDFVGALDWATYVATFTWDSFIAKLEWTGTVAKLESWSAYIGQLNWSSYISTALEWATYVTPLAWDALVATLGDWGAYITALDWTAVITTAIDWATWIPALSWAALITAVDWSLYLLPIAWESFITALDWATATGQGIDWSTFINALTWENVVVALDWATYIATFTWDSFIAKLEWTGTVARLDSWATYITAIDWAGFITSLDWKAIITTTIDWATWIAVLPWNTFVAALEWSAFIGSFAWANYISTFDWSTTTSTLTWGNFVATLSNWGAYVAALPWADYIAALSDWSTFVGSVAWESFIANVEWPSFIPAFSWSSFVAAVDLSSYIPSFPGWRAIFSNFNPFTEAPAQNAAGTSSWRGGVTWVDEKGPELFRFPNGEWGMGSDKGAHLVNLPAGTQIYPHADAQKMLGMAGITPIGRNAEGTNRAPAIWPGGGSSFGDLSQAQALGARFGGTAGKAITGAMKKATDDLKSALRGVEGLFSTSKVTDQQMRMAELGVPQNFADDWIRRLTDEVVNGVDWEGVDIKDAALRAGIDPALPAKAILELVKEKWNDSSFFAGGKNTDLINPDAVREALQRQADAKSGQQALYALFGITPEQASGQAVALGGTINAGVTQGMLGTGGQNVGTQLLGNLAAGITPQALAPVATQITSGIVSSIAAGNDNDKQAAGSDIGLQIANAVVAQLTQSDALTAAGQTILQKLVDSWATVGNIDIASKIAGAMNLNLGTADAIQALQDVGRKLFKIIFQGYDAAASGADYVAPVVTGVNNAQKAGTTSAAPPVQTTERAALGRALFPNAALAGDAGVTVNVYASVAGQLDIVDVAYRVADIIQKRSRR